MLGFLPIPQNPHCSWPTLLFLTSRYSFIKRIPFDYQCIGRYMNTNLRKANKLHKHILVINYSLNVLFLWQGDWWVFSDKIKCFKLLRLSSYLYMDHTMLSYCPCLGFHSPQKAMVISVISPVGYFSVKSNSIMWPSFSHLYTHNACIIGPFTAFHGTLPSHSPIHKATRYK